MIYKRLEADERGWLIEGLNVLNDRWHEVFPTLPHPDLSELHRHLVGAKLVYIAGDAEVFRPVSKTLGEDQ